MALLGCAFTAQAQYQLKNAGFEEWESVSYSGRAGEEPVNWNSFLTGTGNGGKDLRGQAAYNQLEKVQEGRPGTTGSYSAKLFDRNVKILGITIATAQGNLTTGCINMGSMTATDASGNYNYTDESNDNFNQTFTGRPDAMHVWVKYVSTKSNYRAKVNTILHTAGYYQDPKGNTITAKVVAKAENVDIASSTNWQELTIPFVYTREAETPAYALVSFATNATPGQGTGSDYMLVDDLEYLYYSELASLTYEGTSYFETGKTSYDLSTLVYDESKLSISSTGKYAAIEKAYDAVTGLLTVTIKGDNVSVDPANAHVYTIQFALGTVAEPEVTKFTNPLSVGINGATTAPQATTIQLIKEVDGSYSFALNNFMLISGEDEIPVGNIKLTNLDVDGDTYTANQAIAIANGTLDGVDDWFGPFLGDVPVVLTAVRDGDNMTADIDIDMTEVLGQSIKVVFAPEVTLSDGEAPAFTGLKNVTLTRTFTTGWNTICLPFDYSVNAFGEGAKAQAFASATAAGLSFEAVEEMQANVPYLLYVPQDITEPIYFGKQVVAAAPLPVTQGDFTFVGTYESMSMAGKYGVANVDGADRIRLGGANATIKGTCAYFTTKAIGIKEMALLLDVDGTATAISRTEAATEAGFDVYTLTGIQVRKGAASLDGLKAGIYIVNGKKMIIK